MSEGHGRVLRAEDWTPWGEHRLKVEQQLCGMQGREHCVWRVACVDAVCKSPCGAVLLWQSLEDHKLKESKFHILENSVLSVDVLKVVFFYFTTTTVFMDVLKAIFFDFFFVEFALNLVCASGH